MENFKNLLSEARKALDKIEHFVTEKGKEDVCLSTLAAGEQFKVGNTVFIVLQQCQEENQTKVIQQELFAKGVVYNNDSCDYIHSDLKKKFDSEITPAYEVLFGSENIVKHTVDLVSVDMQKYGAFTCKTRPITFDEAREFNELLINKDLPDWWWTCTPWSSEARDWKYSVAVVAPSGLICGDGGYDHLGVRPFCILKSNIFVSRVEE